MELIAEYDYKLAIKGRFIGEDGIKTFRWRPTESQEWSGLNGHKEIDLPLYGDLTRELVFVCEGEKAVDACIKAGLSAACFAGGAGAKEFGVAIESLRRKRVILWPDNDPVGRDFMQRLRRDLDTIALTVRVVAPSVPVKGDAFDYFESGGSVEMLLPTDLMPTVEQTEGGFLITLPDLLGTATFLFEELDSPKAGDLNVEAAISYEAVGKRKQTFSARTNLLSLSARKTLREALDAMIPLAKGEWTRCINEAVEMVREAWLSSVQSLSFSDVPISYDAPRFRIDRFIPEGAVTTLFGMGDAGKGHLAVHLSLCIAAGKAFQGRSAMPGRVMYCDWEDDEGEWAQRVYRHALGMRVEVKDDALSYYPGRGIPLQQQVSALIRESTRRRADVLIIDSAVPACGGDVNKPDVPGPFFNALRRTGCTVILIAHNDKQDNEKYPIGSVMWHNLSRCTWFMSRSEDHDEHVVGMYHKKRNRMRPQAPFGLRFVFDVDDAGPVTVYGQEVGAALDQLKHMKPRDRVLSLLSNGPMKKADVKAIAGITDVNLRTIMHRERRIIGDGDTLVLDV